MIHALRHVSDLEREAGDAAAALTAGQEAVSLLRADPNAPRLDLTNALRVTALAQESLSQSREALTNWREARDLYAALGLPEAVAECDCHLTATI